MRLSCANRLRKCSKNVAVALDVLQRPSVTLGLNFISLQYLRGEPGEQAHGGRAKQGASHVEPRCSFEEFRWLVTCPCHAAQPRTVGLTGLNTPIPCVAIRSHDKLGGSVHSHPFLIMATFLIDLGLDILGVRSLFLFSHHIVCNSVLMHLKGSLLWYPGQRQALLAIPDTS